MHSPTPRSSCSFYFFYLLFSFWSPPYQKINHQNFPSLCIFFFNFFIYVCVRISLKPHLFLESKGEWKNWDSYPTFVFLFNVCGIMFLWLGFLCCLCFPFWSDTLALLRHRQNRQNLHALHSSIVYKKDLKEILYLKKQ